MQLPYISLEQHNTGKRGLYFSSLNYPEDPIHAELTLEETGPREVDRETPSSRRCARRTLAQQRLRGWRVYGWTSALLCSSPCPIHLSLWIISLILAQGGSIVNCKDSQCALLWHETQIPFPSSSGFHGACLNPFVLSPNLALKNKWKGPRMTNTANIVEMVARRIVLYEYSLKCEPAQCLSAFLHSNLPMNANESCLKSRGGEWAPWRTPNWKMFVHRVWYLVNRETNLIVFQMRPQKQ